jgi:hypothetical protein
MTYEGARSITGPFLKVLGASATVVGIYGVLWFAGSALIGFLYGKSLAAMVAFSVVAQLVSVPLLPAIASKRGKPDA